MRLSLFLLFLSFSLFANYRAQFCTETADIQKRAQGLMNELAFTNPDGMDLPIIGDILGMPDGIGACWWHTKMQRAALYLTAFRPELPKPDKEEAKKLIEAIRSMESVVEIPGFNNLREFSYEYEKEFVEVITDWQTSNTFSEFRFTRGIETNSKERLHPDQLKKMMDDLYGDFRRGEIVFQRLPHLDSVVNHAWLVIRMERIERGYSLTVIDSNQKDYYNLEGGSGHFDAKYLYGDRYISYRGDKVVPFTDTIGEDQFLKEARDVYCEGVELLPAKDEEIIVEGEELQEEGGVALTTEQIEGLLYQYLTVGDFSYDHVFYVSMVLRAYQVEIANYFDRIIDNNPELPLAVIYRMMLLTEDLNDLRMRLGGYMLTLVSIDEIDQSFSSFILTMAFSPRGAVDQAGTIGKVFIERFILEERDYKSIIVGLAANSKEFDNIFDLLNFILKSNFAFDSQVLSYIDSAIYLHRDELIAEHLLVDMLLDKGMIEGGNLASIASSIIHGEYPHYKRLLESIVNHPKVTKETLKNMIRNFKFKWPRLEGDDEILLEVIGAHPQFGGQLTSEIKETIQYLEEKKLAKEIIAKLDFSGFDLTSEVNYGDQAVKVSVDATELSESNQSFLLNIGSIHPIEIIVHLQDLHKLKKFNKIRVTFEAPAHVFYETEKVVFDKIFQCSKKNCKEEINGVIVFTDDGIEIFDTDGADGNQLKVIGSR